MDEKTRRILKPEPDWLERANQPSEIDLKVRLMFAFVVVGGLFVVGSVVALFLR